MEKFDNRIQFLRNSVIKEIAKLGFDGNFNKEQLLNNLIADDNEFFQERREAMNEYLDALLGSETDFMIRVSKNMCDKCENSGYVVTSSCRGCLAHPCKEDCKLGAINFKEGKALINKEKCVNCGKCFSVCPYNAIRNDQRPCEVACKVKAINKGKDNIATVNENKCIVCGSCVRKCPFGAILYKVCVLEIINIIKNSANNEKYKVYAIVAPAIASQFKPANVNQVVTGLKLLGFYDVVEAALGADSVALKESRELFEKGFLTSSCCPAFFKYIENEFPDLKLNISHNLSPMAEVGKMIKEREPNAITVFVGPCTSKKMELHEDRVHNLVDHVLTFEEVNAMFEAKNICLDKLKETKLEDATYFGRIFARTGGLTEAVVEAMKEQNLQRKGFKLNPVLCDGVDQCKLALLKASADKLTENFVEGMICVGGCICGAACLKNTPKSKIEVDEHGKMAENKNMQNSLKNFDEHAKI